MQSLFALAAGGLTGTGLGMGLPTRIPFVATDFIFSAIGEELGLLGGAAVILCFLVFAVRGLTTASRAKTDMAAFTAVGLVAGISVQAFVIVGGVTRLIPLTGITLPFVSYGGSSLLSSFIALGLLLRAGDEGTGTETEMQMTSVDLGVLGRLALGRRLTGVTSVIGLLMAALVINLTWIQVVDAHTLVNNPANTRNLANQARSDRGSILTRDGVILAESRPSGRGTFQRVYPKGTFAAHTVGYFSTRYGRAGIEAAENDTLVGGQHAFATWADALDAAAGRPVRGNDVVLTIDSHVQAAASAALAGRRGACVVLDPRTGAVLAMASNPGFDPNTVDAQWAALSAPDKGAPLIDRARSALYPPGSTFKVVTLTGALGTGVATLQTTFPGPGVLQIGGGKVTNFEGGGYGKLDLLTATMKSVNTVFAQLAVKLGAPALVKQADLFGFGKRFGFELPTKTSLMPEPAQMTTWETAWAGVGQPVGEHTSPAGPQATVLQMALVAAGIAERRRRHAAVPRRPHGRRGGRRNAARRSPGADDGHRPRHRRDGPPADGERREGGSGARRGISGVKVAGKTGTAEVGKGVAVGRVVHRLRPRRQPNRRHRDHDRERRCRRAGRGPRRPNRCSKRRSRHRSRGSRAQANRATQRERWSALSQQEQASGLE